MTDTPYQSIGEALELLPVGQTRFTFDEFASVMPLLGNGPADRNYVLQSSSTVVRRAAMTWFPVSDEDLETMQGYAEDKSEQLFTEEDGTERYVVVLDFKPTLEQGGEWSVGATLLEVSDPTPPGS